MNSLYSSFLPFDMNSMASYCVPVRLECCENCLGGLVSKEAIWNVYTAWSNVNFASNLKLRLKLGSERR
jgi:hypothetical protein